MYNRARHNLEGKFKNKDKIPCISIEITFLQKQHLNGARMMLKEKENSSELSSQKGIHSNRTRTLPDEPAGLEMRSGTIDQGSPSAVA